MPVCSVPVGDRRDSCFCLHWKETPPSTTSVSMAVRQDPTLLSSVLTFHLMPFRMTGEVEQILCMFENLQGGILRAGGTKGENTLVQHHYRFLRKEANIFQGG